MDAKLRNGIASLALVSSLALVGAGIAPAAQAHHRGNSRAARAKLTHGSRGHRVAAVHDRRHFR